MSLKNIKIGGRWVGSGCKPFTIAEMSGNHNQSLDRALQIVDAIAETGADAVKLQTYTADTMTLNLASGDFKISDPKSPWFNRTLYELYDEAHTPWEWHKTIFDRAREKGLICFSTPFDSTSVDFLESLDSPLYKIASFENTDHSLIRKVAETGKPLIISTGMASLADISAAVAVVKETGNDQLILLKCTSSYPADPALSNVLTIPHMQQAFNCQIGISDHTLGIGAAIASVVLGGTVIEKHFTIRRSDGGVDSTFSLEPDEFKMLVTECETARKSLGQVSYAVGEAESKSMQFRRSLYFTESLEPGEVVSASNMRAIRPGYGLSPQYLEKIVGMTVKKRVSRGDPVSWDSVSNQS